MKRSKYSALKEKVIELGLFFALIPYKSCKRFSSDLWHWYDWSKWLSHGYVINFDRVLYQKMITIKMIKKIVINCDIKHFSYPKHSTYSNELSKIYMIHWTHAIAWHNQGYNWFLFTKSINCYVSLSYWNMFVKL